MFLFISWQQYLIILSGMCFIYYLGILLWFYQKEFLHFIGAGPNQLAEEEVTPQEESILGKVKSSPTQTVSIEELEFSEQESNFNVSNPHSHEN